MVFTCFGSRGGWRGAAWASVLAWVLAAPLSAAALDFEDVAIPWKGVRVEQFSDEAASGELTGKLAKPSASPAPYVVFMHGCGGLKLDNVRHWAEFFTSRGVGVLMVDSFSSRRRQEACSDGGSAWTRRRADDAASALGWLSEQSFARPDRIALMGQSQGGTAVLFASHKNVASGQRIAGAIAMYPSCRGAVNGNLQYEKPLIVLVGDADTWTPAAACQDLKAMQHAPAMELTVYPGARHSFDNPGVYRMALGKYPVGEHAASRDKARERVARFIEENLR